MIHSDLVKIADVARRVFTPERVKLVTTHGGHVMIQVSVERRPMTLYELNRLAGLLESEPGAVSVHSVTHAIEIVIDTDQHTPVE